MDAVTILTAIGTLAAALSVVFAFWQVRLAQRQIKMAERPQTPQVEQDYQDPQEFSVEQDYQDPQEFSDDMIDESLETFDTKIIEGYYSHLNTILARREWLYSSIENEQSKLVRAKNIIDILMFIPERNFLEAMLLDWTDPFVRIYNRFTEEFRTAENTFNQSKQNIEVWKREIQELDYQMTVLNNILDWTPGEANLEYSDVIASDIQGHWQPAPGYRWIDPDDNNDFQVFWLPGKEHPDHSNVLTGDIERQWKPAPGYRWIDPDDNNDFQVFWLPGKEHPDHSNVLAGDTERGWKPAPGYRWVYPDDQANLEVEPE